MADSQPDFLPPLPEGSVTSDWSYTGDGRFRFREVLVPLQHARGFSRKREVEQRRAFKQDGELSWRWDPV